MHSHYHCKWKSSGWWIVNDCCSYHGQFLRALVSNRVVDRRGWTMDTGPLNECIEVLLYTFSMDKRVVVVK